MLSTQPVFVVGVFRSGTSLLCSILNQNPKIALMYECDVWNFPSPLLNLRFRSNWAERIEFFNQALSRHQLVTSGDNSVLKQIREPADLYRVFGEKKGAVVSGEKSPFYCDRLLQLHKTYPNAFFIIVWRSPVEVYRSVLSAGETSRFFGRPGMLSRMIYDQEQVIHQARMLEKNGARLMRVDYASLVDQTEKICREVCAFLAVDYSDQMLRLNKADLTSIYKAPHHSHLRRGVIERRKYDQELMPPAIIKKLERYQCHWERLQADWLKPKIEPSPLKPGAIEFFWHNFAGCVLTDYDALVRAGFEFLPMQWLRVYRVLKNWLVNPPSGARDEKTSIIKDCKKHWHTLISAAALLWAIMFVQEHSSSHLNFMLLYAVPCALVALVVNTRWATLFVVAAAVASPLARYNGGDHYSQTPLVMAWNIVSSTVILEIIVLLLGRIRLEFKDTDHHVK